MMMMIDGDGDTISYILQFKYAPIRYHPTSGCCSWVMTFLFDVDDDDDDSNDNDDDSDDDNDVWIVLLL